MVKLTQNKTTYLIVGLFLIILLLLSFVLGMKLPWSKQVVIYDALRQTSILIFGLIGAWFAVLLPFSLEKKEHLGEFFSFSKKLFPALSSAIYLLVITLCVPLFVSVFKEYCAFSEITTYFFRGVSLMIVCFGLIILLYGLLMILASFDTLKKNIESKEKNLEIDKQYKTKEKKE